MPYVVDYGTFPRQGKPYFAVRDLAEGRGLTLEDAYRSARGKGEAPPEVPGREGLWRWALEKVCGDLCGRRYARDDGVEMRIDRLVIDANYGESTDVVYDFCRESGLGSKLTPLNSTGVTAKQKPMNLYEQRRGGGRWIMCARTSISGRRL